MSDSARTRLSNQASSRVGELLSAQTARPSSAAPTVMTSTPIHREPTQSRLKRGTLHLLAAFECKARMRPRDPRLLITPHGPCGVRKPDAESFRLLSARWLA